MTPDHWQLLAEHRFLPAGFLARTRANFVLGGVFLAVAVGLFVLDSIDPSAGAFWAGIVVAILGILWLVPVVVAYWHSIKQVRIFEQGIGWMIHGPEEFRAWSELREIFRRDKNTNRFRQQSEMVLVFKKKEQIVLDQCLTDYFALTTLIEAIVTETLLPSYRQALDQDGARFGPVELTRQAIRINEHEFAWDAVEEYAICNGGIVVTPLAYEDFTGEHVPFSSIPNQLLLLRLLEELGKRPVPAERSILVAGRKKT